MLDNGIAIHGTGGISHELQMQISRCCELYKSQNMRSAADQHL
jgi:hypothetical protein